MRFTLLHMSPSQLIPKYATPQPPYRALTPFSPYAKLFFQARTRLHTWLGTLDALVSFVLSGPVKVCVHLTSYLIASKANKQTDQQEPAHLSMQRY